MPIADSPSTSKRLLALLSLLQARRDWPAPVLARRLEVSERTVRRDIDRLRELDYTIDSTRGPDGGYRLQAGSHLPPLRFDDEQAVAIALALRTAGGLGADLDEAAERALGTLSRLMPAHLANRIANLSPVSVSPAPGGAAAAPVDPGLLVRIGEAIRAEEELRFDYASPSVTADTSDGEVGRRTEPHHLLLHSGRWYLIGYSAVREDWRIYRVDRINARSHNGRRFTPRTVPGGDPARFLSARFRGSDTEDTWACWGEATLPVPLAEVAPYLGDGTAEALDDERSRVRLGSWSWGSLAAAFSRWDAPISDVQPRELRSAFAALADRAAAAASA
ncbi:WYL domain-containing transcriptional regulator [Labedella phragmitis]|uniref:WYL domain-containing transcriptional regulator n=1 Tax=Labedella phragmitis TaxID=2498849 RepID=A0A3S3Z8L4_9MICO|nr:WYL domain-containing protein [Labedella phragmitis]RWZ51159.1 WYL domain-containing transcriptional regulator [Labedella phragmitis]